MTLKDNFVYEIYLLPTDLSNDPGHNYISEKKMQWPI